MIFDNESLHTEVHRQLQAATRLSELAEVLDVVHSHFKANVLSYVKFLQLTQWVFQTGIGFIRGNCDSTRSVILERLLPLCYTSVPTEDQSEINITLHSLNSVLKEWIDEYRNVCEVDVRDDVTAQLGEQLSKGNTLARRALSQLGYRSDYLKALQWSIVEGDEGDRAGYLSLIVSLGLRSDERARVVELLRRSITPSTASKYTYVLQQLAEPDLLDLLVKLTTHADTDLEFKRFFSLSCIARIADFAPEDESLQDLVWTTIRHLYDSNPEIYGRSLSFMSGIASRCNSRHVVPFLLSGLLEKSKTENPAQGQWGGYHRLEECTSPRHVASYADVNSRELRHLLFTICTGDSGRTGRFATVQSDLKRQAFETSLSLGNPDSISWFDRAIENESNGYVRHSLMELLACFPLEPLPSIVKTWVKDPFEVTPGYDEATNEGFVLRLGAIAIAGSSPTEEAFETLLDPGLHIAGDVFRVSSDALANVSVDLIRRGNKKIVPRLIEVARNRDSSIYSRIVAASSLQVLGALGLLPADVIGDLLDLAVDSSLKVFSRRRVLEAIAELHHADSSTLSRLCVLAEGDEDELAWPALQALASRGQLAEVREDVIERRLGLRCENQKWTCTESPMDPTWQAFIVGVLYRRDSSMAQQAVAEVIDKADFGSIDAILYQLAAQPRGQSANVEPTAVVDALINRIKARLTRFSAETGIFSVLGALSIDRLVAEPWETSWDEWHPEAKIALANVLADERIHDARSFGRTLTLLRLLAADGTFAVRRSAYRTLAAIDVSAFAEYCKEWSTGDCPDRCRSAEALEWLPADKVDSGIVQLHADLVADPELEVRETANKSWQDRWRRKWSQAYLDKVLQAKTGGDVLQCFRYGRALCQIGNDGDQRTLERHIQRPDLPANVYHWLKLVIKAIRRRWDEEARKWPKPWMVGRDIVEEIDGVIRLEDGEFSAHFHLWLRPRRSPSDLGSWGGVAVSEVGGSNMLKSLAMETDTAQLLIPNREPAEAIVSAQTWHSLGGVTIVLHGNGPYPIETRNR